MKKYPKWAKWIVQDKDLTWWIYERKPVLQSDYWYCNFGKEELVYEDEFTNNWKESLQEIKE